MSVHVSERTLSPHEFVHTYKIIRGILCQWMEAVPKRKRKYVCPPIYDNIYATTEYLIRIDEQVFKPKTRNEVDFTRDVLMAVDKVQHLPDAMIAYCIICRKEQQKLERVEELINKELTLLEGIVKRTNPTYRAERIKIYNRKMVLECKFLSKLEELVLLTHQKIPYVPNRYDFTIKNPATQSVVSAYRKAYAANCIYPEVKNDIERRSKLFKEAIAYLVQYEDYIATLFLLSEYDDALMDRWAHLVSESQKLISGTMKSDRDRCPSLPDEIPGKNQQ